MNSVVVLSFNPSLSVCVGVVCILVVLEVTNGAF